MQEIFYFEVFLNFVVVQVAFYKFFRLILRTKYKHTLRAWAPETASWAHATKQLLNLWARTVCVAAARSRWNTIQWPLTIGCRRPAVSLFLLFQYNNPGLYFPPRTPVASCWSYKTLQSGNQSVPAKLVQLTAQHTHHKSWIIINNKNNDQGSGHFGAFFRSTSPPI